MESCCNLNKGRQLSEVLVVSGFFVKIKYFKSAVIFCAGIFVFHSQGKIINAGSCSQNDVQTAVSAASAGDLILLPAGSSKWSGSLNVNKQNITLQGNGIGKTIITGVSKSILLTGEQANNLRITNIEFQSGSQFIYARGSGTPEQAIKKFRVDHCKFVKVDRVLETVGGATGVFDHCIFLDTYGARLYGSNDAKAMPPYKLGTSDAVFFEDNTITVTTSGNPAHFIGSNSHSKYVIRHNTFNYSASLWDIIDAHGACEVRGRGSATWEVYDNTFALIPYISRVIHLRGGQGVVFNNTFTGYKPSKPITITDYAVCNPPCSQSCTTYPCPDQINHSYFWDNKIDNTPVDPVNNCSDFIKKDRDYYTYQMPGYTPYTYPHPLTISDKQRHSTEVKPASAALSKAVISVAPDALTGFTRINYSLKERTPVRISVYNVHGILVENLVNGIQTSGRLFC